MPWTDYRTTTNREFAERSTILRGLVGSTVHGLNVNDGIEDRDEMGVCVEPFEAAMSLCEPVAFDELLVKLAELEERINRSAGNA